MNTKQLRQKILDLAIRGKLIPQDPNDEPASVLLERIHAEKERLIKEGKIKRNKKDSAIFRAADKSRYGKLPDGWEVVQIQDVCVVNPRNAAEDSDIASFVPMTLIADGFSNCFTFQKRAWGEIKSGFTHFQEGDVGLAKITPCLENKKSVVFHGLTNGIGAGTTELHIFRPICSSIISEYLLWFFKNERFINGCISAFSGAVGQQRVNKDYVSSTLLPLPPLAEQRRIVSAIESAFAVIDKIEQNKTDLQSAIAATKQKILSLAIRGKLVPQDPNDEPASVLLERIRSERETLVKTGKIKRGKGDSSIVCSDDSSYYEKIDDKIVCIDTQIPFDIPKSWEYARLASICSLITDGTHQTPSYSDDGYIFLSSKNVTSGEIDWVNVKFIPQELHEQLYSRLTPELGDILLAKNGTTGFAAIVDRDCVFDIYVSLALIRAFKQEVSPDYLCNVISSKPIQEHFKGNLKGIGVPNLHLEHIKSAVIPIPPIAEQHRIVTAIKTAFEQLDKIAENLN